MTHTFVHHDRYSDINRNIMDALWAVINSAEVVYAMRVVSDPGVPAVVGAEKRLLDAGLVIPRRDKIDDRHDCIHRCQGPWPGRSWRPTATSWRKKRSMSPKSARSSPPGLAMRSRGSRRPPEATVLPGR